MTSETLEIHYVDTDNGREYFIQTVDDEGFPVREYGDGVGVAFQSKLHGRKLEVIVPLNNSIHPGALKVDDGMYSHAYWISDLTNLEIYKGESNE